MRRMNSTIKAPGRILGGPIKGAETLVWCALAAIVALSHLRIAHGPLLSNDGYQYLSVANNFLTGNPANTSIIHFDPERSWGRVPAPLTTFPPGYPLAVAAVDTTGVGIEPAALLVSVLSFVLLVPLFAWGARTLSSNGGVTRTLLACLIGNSWVAIYATSATTESLFTLVSSAAIIVLLAAGARAEAFVTQTGSAPQPGPAAARSNPPGYLRLLLLGSALIGLSYWVRYAGLFLLAGVGVFHLMQLARRRDRPALQALLSLAVAAAIIGAGFVRNQLLVGSWKGGNTKVVHHPLKEVFREFILWMHHLFFGGIADARAGVPEVLLLLGILAIVLATVYRRGGPTPQRRRLTAGPTLLLCYAAVYCAGMVYLGVTSVISFDTRMFYPVLPVLLLLLAVALTAAVESTASTPQRALVFTGGLLLATCAYLVINARSYFTPLPPAPHEGIERQLEGEATSGMTLRQWLEAHVPSTATIVANRGQASAYALHRNTVSLITSEYSDQQWNEPAMRALMRRFGARYLILYTGDAPSLVTLSESPFLAGLAQGARSDWLTPAARNHDVLVFEATP